MGSRSKFLLALRQIVKRAALDEFFEFFDHVEMLSGCPLRLLEFGKVLNYALHVFDRVELSLTLLGLQEFVHQGLNFS